MSVGSVTVLRMTTDAATPKSCVIDLDGWRPDLQHWLWTDVDSRPLRTTFSELAALLAGLVDRPDEVTLVIAVDFAEAVMRRDPSVHYSTTRGSGMVGGRTMLREDGKIDVLIDGNWLVDVNNRGHMIPKVVGVDLMRRSIQHEAQHVVMCQRGSGFEDYGRHKVSGWIDVHMFDFASLVLDEHRAEWGAIAISAEKHPSTTDVADVLSALSRQLTAVESAYQRSMDVRALMEGTLTACRPFWVALAYWAAQYRSPESITPPPAEILRMSLWQRYVGESWSALADAFCQVPVADLSTTPDVLHKAAQSMATALRSSLHVVGFHYTEDDSGSAFYIHRHDFPTR